MCENENNTGACGTNVCPSLEDIDNRIYTNMDISKTPKEAICEGVCIIEIETTNDRF